MVRSAATGAALLALTLLAAGPAGAASGTELSVSSDTTPSPHWSPVTGRVVDAGSGEPVSGATVSISGLERSDLTGADGRFRLSDVPPGGYRLLVRHVAYGTREVEASVRAWTVTRLTVRLEQKAIEVEPIRVRVEHRPEYLIDAGFYRRREAGWGEFIEPAEVDSLIEGWSRPQQWMPVLLMQHANTDIDLGRCPPCGDVRFFVGRRSAPGVASEDHPTWLLENLSGREVEAVEIYPDGHGAPAYTLPLPGQGRSLPNRGSDMTRSVVRGATGDPRPTVVVIWLGW